jgi:8-oxo-dGTP pyrophosphatase MutT (NUDIX family)
MKKKDVVSQIQQALSDYTPKKLAQPTASPAAVLILVRVGVGEPQIVFTERTHQVEHHKGQVSFPGGACDDDDASPEATALRETFEEIGVRPDDVRLLGRLDDMVTISNFRVTPFVGVITSESSYDYKPNDEEVASIIEVPLSFLLDEQNMELEVRQHAGREVLVPAFAYDGHRIWGATARMTHQLVELIR